MATLAEMYVQEGVSTPGGQGDHLRGAVRPALLGLGHLRHQQALDESLKFLEGRKRSLEELFFHSRRAP